MLWGTFGGTNFQYWAVVLNRRFREKKVVSVFEVFAYFLRGGGSHTVIRAFSLKLILYVIYLGKHTNTMYMEGSNIPFVFRTFIDVESTPFSVRISTEDTIITTLSSDKGMVNLQIIEIVPCIDWNNLPNRLKTGWRFRFWCPDVLRHPIKQLQNTAYREQYLKIS